MNRADLSKSVVLSIVILVVFGCSERQERPKARFVRQTDWIGEGQWLKADTHVHTTFSDGSHTVAEVVDRAVLFGCDVIAITDHGDCDESAATEQYGQAIEAAREQYPESIILAGLEWNVPPYGGDEHATVLIPPGPNEWQILAQFKQEFDDWKRESHHASLADEALKWLAEHACTGGVSPVVLHNHPSCKRETNTDAVDDLKRWRAVNDLVIGFSGAPGHQQAKPLGAYEGQLKLCDRWDPAVEVGAGWDLLLKDGLDVWAARAASDFHHAGRHKPLDYWPGEFSETWLCVPERTAAGVLAAFRAGTFFASHGHIVREVELMVDAYGLPRPAQVGEVIEVPLGTEVRVYLRYTLPPLDWQLNPNQIDLVELIVITADGAELLASRPPQKVGSALVEEIEVPAGGLVVRARGRREVEDGPDLMFYTNPVRVVASQLAGEPKNATPPSSVGRSVY